MILFAIYALFVWYLTLRFRRRWQGFACAVVGSLLAALVGRLIPTIGIFSDSGLQFQLLVWGESAIVLFIGLFIAVLPRPPTGKYCRYCWYDLSGLEGDKPVCPECGTPLEWDELKRKRVVPTPKPSGVR